jgi:hypothetical protein
LVGASECGGADVSPIRRAFAAQYGSGKKHANAFGKCVSMEKKAVGPSRRRIRTNCRRSHRAPIRRARTRRCSRTCSVTTRPCGPRWVSFLERTWRLRPEVNGFISETFYEGRLEPAEVCRTRSLAVNNGLRYIPVEDVGRRISSPEEAKAVRAEVDRLVGTVFRDGDRERPLTHADIVVVAPYNAQVRCLREHLPTAVRVGTVDKFQGQEAAVVFYSMASSSGEDVPRGLDFLFSRNRLNVAISRAECLAYLVASPRLLDASCRTVEQMRLANALCRLVELAESQTSSTTPPSPLRT